MGVINTYSIKNVLGIKKIFGLVTIICCEDVNLNQVLYWYAEVTLNFFRSFYLFLVFSSSLLVSCLISQPSTKLK